MPGTKNGADLVDRGNPVREALGVDNRGAGAVLGGFSLVTADNLKAAAARAKVCPALRHGGGVEVGRLIELCPNLASGHSR